jgi:hypothetical protein
LSGGFAGLDFLGGSNMFEAEEEVSSIFDVLRVLADSKCKRVDDRGLTAEVFVRS